MCTHGSSGLCELQGVSGGGWYCAEKLVLVFGVNDFWEKNVGRNQKFYGDVLFYTGLCIGILESGYGVGLGKARVG